MPDNTIRECSCDFLSIDDGILFPLLQTKMAIGSTLIYTEHFLRSDSKDPQKYFKTWGFQLHSTIDAPLAETVFLQEKERFLFLPPARQYVLKRK